MKKIIVTVIAVASISLMSCDKQSVNPISEEFSSIDLATGEDANGFRQGRPSLDSVNLEDLPSNITDYISSNYPDANIERAGTDHEGNFVVLILNEEGKQAILFDGDGNFVKELERRRKGKRPPMQEVAVEDLPSNITTYISSNYAEANIEKSGTKPNGEYVVVIFQGEKKQGLLFDVDGNFLKEVEKPKGQRGIRPNLTAVEIDDLDANITAYISENYPEMSLEKAGTNEAGEFIIIVKGDDKPLALLFDASGAFQKELPPPYRRRGPQE